MNMFSTFLSPLSRRGTSVQPFKDLRHEIDRIFDNFGDGFRWPAGWPAAFAG